MTIRAIDLFCGGGGSSWGAADAGVELVGAVDAWDLATATYRDNFPTAARNVITARMDVDSGPDLFTDLGKIDLLLASPECTNHSVARGARARDAHSQKSGLFAMNFIEELQPRWVVFENVLGMRRWDGFAGLVSDLKGKGYKLRMQSLDSAAFGVPQNRRRLFIMGDREGRPPLVTGGWTRQQVPASYVIDRKGSWKNSPLYKEGRAQATLDRAERAMAELGRGKDFLIVYYGSDRVGGWQSLDRPLRTLTTLDRFGLVQWKDDIPMMRMLQVPELKAAMGLPVTFALNHGSRRDQVRLLGNGVAAPVMQAVVQTLVGGVAASKAA
jgi:DNA (cytosine-5)-methyltransferase 1